MHYLVILGAAVNILGTSFYIKDTIYGDTRPNRVTWFLWSLIPMIAFTAEIKAGVGWAALPVFVAGFTPFMGLMATFFNRNSYWKLGTLDYICGALSIAAIVLWQTTGDPNFAVAFAILADALATVPTYKKTWSHPTSESPATYLGGIFSALTGIVVLEEYSFKGLAFLIYAMSQCLTILLLIYRPRFSRRTSESR